MNKSIAGLSLVFSYCAGVLTTSPIDNVPFLAGVCVVISMFLFGFIKEGW